MKRLAGLTVGFMLLAPAMALAACDLPDGWQQMKAAGSGEAIVAVKLPSNPLPVGELFDIEVMVCGGEDTGDTVLAGADATMPAHRHGMNYRPVVEEPGANSNAADARSVTGFLFHMPGAWRISVDLGSVNRRRYLLDVTAK